MLVCSVNLRIWDAGVKHLHGHGQTKNGSLKLFDGLDSM